MRREFDRHNGHFHEYADRFPGGRGHESNRPHPSGGSGRGRGGGIAQLPPSNLPPRQFHNGPRHALSANYPYGNEYMGYSGWGAAEGHWLPPPEDACGYGLAVNERSFGEGPYGNAGGRYGFCHPPDDGHYTHLRMYYFIIYRSISRILYQVFSFFSRI